MKKIFFPSYKRLSIKTKLVIAFCIISLCPIILLGYFGYRSYENTMKDKFLSYAKGNSSHISGQVQEVFEGMVNFSNSILYDDVIQETHDEYIHMEDSDISHYIIKRKLDGYLQSLLLARPELDMVAFKFAGRDGLYASKRRFTRETSRPLPIDEIYKDTDKAPDLKCYLHAEEGLVKDIYFYRVVYNRNDMQEMGILVFKISRDRILPDNYLNSPIDGIYIYSDGYDQILKAENSRDLHIDSMVGLLKGAKEPGIYGVDEDFIIYETIEPLGWNLFMSISSDELFKEVRSQSRLILILSLSTLPIILMVINYMFSDIIRPINGLVNKMHDLETGRTGVTMDWDREDEIGYLISSFNKMSIEIDDLINRVYKEEIAFANAEIKALQAQINPHFLYNTLEAINWKAQLLGADEISDMIMALSALMEASIDRNGEKFITLREEIDYVENYIFIIQKRFGDRIIFEKEIDKGVLDYNIPRLILQPLVENAIHHGLGPRGWGKVRLSAGLKDGNLVIGIIDDGVGIDGDTMAWISGLLEHGESELREKETVSNTEIGLINVHRRIQLIFGKGYGIGMKSSPRGTSVYITLPPSEGDYREGVVNVV